MYDLIRILIQKNHFQTDDSQFLFHHFLWHFLNVDHQSKFICVAESLLVELIGCYFVFCSVLLWTLNSESLSCWEVWKLLMPTSSSWMHLPGSWMHLPVPCSASMLQRPNLSFGPVLKVSKWHCLSPSQTQSNQMTGLWTLPSVLRLEFWICVLMTLDVDTWHPDDSLDTLIMQWYYCCSNATI